MCCACCRYPPVTGSSIVLLQAIIVDAFCEVKESTSSSVSIFSDLNDTLRVRSADVRALGSSLLWWRPRTSLTTSETGRLLKRACTAVRSDDPQSSQLEPESVLGADKRVLQLGTTKLTRQDVADVLREQQHNLAEAWKTKGGSDMQQDLQKLSYWIFERFSEEDRAHSSEYKFPELEVAAGDDQNISGQDVRPTSPPYMLLYS